MRTLGKYSDIVGQSSCSLNLSCDDRDPQLNFTTCNLSSLRTEVAEEIATYLKTPIKKLLWASCRVKVYAPEIPGFFCCFYMLLLFKKNTWRIILITKQTRLQSLWDNMSAFVIILSALLPHTIPGKLYKKLCGKGSFPIINLKG